MSGITKSDDGTWTWVYEQDLYHNRIMLSTACKIMAAVCLGLALFMGVMLIVVERQWNKLPLFLLIAVGGTLGLLGLSVLIYYLFALSQGGRRATAFAMNDQGITYKALPPRTEDVNALTVLGDFADMAFRPPSARAVDVYAPQHIDFAKVRRVKPDPAHDAIKVSSGITFHQVYAPVEDFGKVLAFINAHTSATR